MVPFARLVLVLAAVLAVTACSPRPDPPKTPADVFAPPTDLTAVLAEQTHIDLSWKNNNTEAGGAFLEFNMNPGEEFSILEIVTADTVKIRHPDVAPDTRFGYRLRQFFGRPSDVVEITTGKAPPRPLPEEEGPLGPAEADASAKPSVRSVSSMDAARPAGLTAALASTTTVDLRWQDRAGDEEGYLVEVTDDPARPFRVCALLPANTTSFRKIRLPGDTRFHFRVRAYFLGQPSATTTLHTPAATQAGRS